MSNEGTMVAPEITPKSCPCCGYPNCGHATCAQTAQYPLNDPPDELKGTAVFYSASADRLRLLGAAIRKSKGGFTSDQVRAFLLLHGEDLQEAMDQTVRDFITKKVG